MTSPNIVSGAVATMAELDKDEAWLQGWLKEQPSRLGLGELDVSEGATDDEARSFVATDDGRCFSVDVQLGEMEASHGFQLLDNWARNRVLHPDKTHVAVLVTETAGERYKTTLETLSEHLPLVVVELQVWRGESEAIVVPHVALSSNDVDLSLTPAAKAADVIAKTEEVETKAEEPTPTADTSTDAAVPAGESVAAESEPVYDSEADESESKDDTGVADPWGLPQAEPETVKAESESPNGHRLLSNIGS
jgi:hypothetical protein